jgi:hypothetical protein
MSSRQRRFLLLSATGLLSLACLACVAVAFLWAANPNIDGARLTSISRFEFGTEQCINVNGRVVQGGAFYVTRIFFTPENISDVTIWYISHGWDALTLYVNKSGLVRTMGPLRYDLLMVRATMVSGISLYRNVDNSTQIEMRSTMILCPS